MKKITIIIALCFAAIVQIGAQNMASNVRVQVQSNILIVYYDLAEKSDVEAYVSFDDGSTWQGPMRNVSGSVGNGIEAGRDKIIVWRSIDEIGSVESNSSVRVIATRVTATTRPADVAAFIATVTPGISPPSAVEETPEPVVEPEPVAAAPVAQPPPAAAPRPTTTASGSGRWVVIIGSFQLRSNAENFVRQMHAEGLNCEIIDADNQMFRVSAGRFDTFNQANNLANELRPARQGQVWITTN